MRRKQWRPWLTAWMACGLFLGCDRAAVTPKPPDPLLISKKPTETKAILADPVQVVHSEPAAPSVPSTALAAAPALLKSTTVVDAAPDRDQSGIPAVPNRPTDTAVDKNKPPLSAIPAVRTGNSPGVVGSPALLRKE